VRIAHVSPFDIDGPGVVADHVRAVARHQARAGHEVIVLGPARSRAALREGRERRSALASGRPGALTPLPGQPLTIAVGPALPLRGARVAAPVAAAVNAALVARDGSFDIVHVHEPVLSVLAMGAARRSSAPCVVTLHSASELVLAQARRAVMHGDALVATSRAIAEAAGARAGGDWQIVPAGVELGPRVPLADPPRLVVEAASDDRAAVRALRRGLSGAACELVVVAPGRRGAAAAGERRALLAGAAILIASRGTSPQVALEAMAAGAAVCAASGSGAAELVEHERTGLLYPADGQPELAVAVALRLLHDPDLRAAIAERGARQAQGSSYAAVGDALLGIYDELSARRRPPVARVGDSGDDRDHLLCDLHMHTLHSHDSATAVDALLDRALELGLGAIAVTDHNTIAGGIEARERAHERGLPLRVIVGSEVKTESQGEIIGLFLDEEVERGLSLAETLSRIHAQGGLVYVPHPFDRMHTIPSPDALRRHIDDIDLFETCNGRLWFDVDNERAARFARRYNLLAGAGSDAHVSEGLATACLRMAPFDGPEDFLLSLRDAQIVRRPRSMLYLQALKRARQARKRA